MKVKILVIGFAIFSLIFTVSFVGSLIYYDGLIFKKTENVEARVTNYDKDNHSSVYYMYEVDGVTYEGVNFAEGYKMVILLRSPIQKPIPKNLILQKICLDYFLFLFFT